MTFTLTTECSATDQYDKARCRAHEYNNTEYKFAERAKEPIYADSWISPSGYQYIVGMCGHNHAAMFHSNFVRSDSQPYAVEAFEADGWIHFGLDYDCPVVEYNGKVRPTQAQVDTIFDILMDGRKGVTNNTPAFASQVDALDRWFRQHSEYGR